ncbi:MAG: asparagine synthetase B family protein, partial [Arenimonas sp.]
MSGIAGIIRFDGAPIEPGLVEKMIASMSHRGPDGSGFWQQSSIAFGHCNLRTTTESLKEVQPWPSEDGRYVLVMDGRLDNWEALPALLKSQACRLRNNSDAELVMQAFLLWGIDCLKHLEGDFAFVIWDCHERKVHCVRDRMGAKPFHYHWSGNTFSFASELHALFQLPWVTKSCNENMLVDHFMAQWCSKDETAWKEIYRLPQAHRLEINSERFQIDQYWQPDLDTLLNFKSDEEYFECYRTLFIEAVRRSSRASQKVAFEVSGGLDSSALFASADYLEKQARLPAPGIEAYTLDFHDDPAANELDYVAAVSTHLGRDIHAITPSVPSLDWHREWARQYGQMPPYPNSVMAAGIREQSRSNGSKALIVGVGGDEWLVAGRSYYAEEMRAR